MIDPSLDAAVPLIHGALEITRRSTGIVPLRLPAWACREAPDALTLETFATAAGVRLEFVTNASAVELEVVPYRTEIQGLDLPVYPLVIDLVVDGSLWESKTLSHASTRRFAIDGTLVETSRKRPVTAAFDELPERMKKLEIWFPQNAVIELCALRADAPLEPLPQQRAKWIHHGSSISHCYEAHSPTQTWPAAVARARGFDLLNLGVAGNCHLDPFVARTIRDTEASLITLEIGVNIAETGSLTTRTFTPAVHGFLDTIRDGHPDTPIVLVSPIICPALEATSPAPSAGRPGSSLSLAEIRGLLADLTATRRTEDPTLVYLDGLTLFGDSDVADLPDGVHPNGDGYLRIADRFLSAGFFSDALLAGAL